MPVNVCWTLQRGGPEAEGSRESHISTSDESLPPCVYAVHIYIYIYTRVKSLIVLSLKILD